MLVLGFAALAEPLKQAGAGVLVPLAAALAAWAYRRDEGNRFS